MKYIYLHGGPGLNSFAEETILSAKYAKNGLDVDFWNEPKNLKTNSPYQEILTNLVDFVTAYKEPVIIIAHSWGSRTLIDTLPLLESNVHAACLLSPAIEFMSADRRICNFALSLLTEDQVASKNKIEEFLKSKNDKFDNLREEALLAAFSSNYFIHNFVQTSSFEKYFSYLTQENSFRLEEMLKIRRSMPLTPKTPNKLSSIKASVIFGCKDPIFKKSTEEKIIRENFQNLEIIEMEGVSHYPHIESPEKVISELKKLI